ncbi:MAG: cupredoxin domain-containing protein [Gammaproteobacteria bacterium]
MGTHIALTRAPLGWALICVALSPLWSATARAEQAGHQHGRGTAGYGQPGSESEVARTIEVTALDSMRHEPSNITVKTGETVKFVVRNAGQMRHELMLGGAKEQREHTEMMRAHPDMVHDDPNAVTVEPGQTKTLLWRFGAPGWVEGACHLPGHYEAGMVTRIQVTE